MIVVSDTSAISNLLTINEAELLQRLFEEVIVPPAVLAELRRFHPDIPNYVREVAPKDHGWINRALSELHLGEAEAICLARELSADRLLIDEKRGRQVAVREGVKIIGVVGLLIAAKKRAHRKRRLSVAIARGKSGLSIEPPRKRSRPKSSR